MKMATINSTMIPRPPLGLIRIRIHIHIPSTSLTQLSLLFPLKHSVSTNVSVTTISPILKYKSQSPFIISSFKKLSDLDSISLSDDSVSSASRVYDDSVSSASGVYVVFDSHGHLQFIGLSTNVSASVHAHRSKVPQLCSSVKVGIVDEPNRESLTQAWKSWMEEHIKATSKFPPGNETGNTTWFRPPPKRKADLRLTPGRHVQLTVPLEQLIDKLVKENKVVAFIKGSRFAPQCGFSQRVIGILESQGVDYESVDVLDEEYNSEIRETLKSYSNWPTFPLVFVNGELVGGCDIMTSMYEKGELASLFK